KVVERRGDGIAERRFNHMADRLNPLIFAKIKHPVNRCSYTCIEIIGPIAVKASHRIGDYFLTTFIIGFFIGIKHPAFLKTRSGTYTEVFEELKVGAEWDVMP